MEVGQVRQDATNGAKTAIHADAWRTCKPLAPNDYNQGRQMPGAVRGVGDVGPNVGDDLSEVTI